MFISIEGIDGCGKSSVAGFIYKQLLSLNKNVVLLREPGSTGLGERIRSILLDADSLHITGEAELFLYFSSRAQMIREVLQPALEKNNIVICDRFIDSSFAYQGAGLGLGMEKIRTIFELFFSALYPDLTILLDSEPKLALKRLNGSADRIEKRGVSYYNKVRNAFLDIAKMYPDRIKVINADRPLEELKEMTWQTVSSCLK